MGSRDRAVPAYTAAEVKRSMGFENTYQMCVIVGRSCPELSLITFTVTETGVCDFQIMGN